VFSQGEAIAGRRQVQMLVVATIIAKWLITDCFASFEAAAPGFVASIYQTTAVFCLLIFINYWRHADAILFLFCEGPGQTHLSTISAKLLGSCSRRVPQRPKAKGQMS